MFGSAPSQDVMVRTLAAAPDIDWSRVQSLHVDEYRGIDPNHSAGFGRWLADRIPAAGQNGLMRIRSTGGSEDELLRYTALLEEEELDLVCVGIGVNGHIAFNEPGDTDFNDPKLMREVVLAHATRKQQVDEGLFPSLDMVPTTALSVTVPAIMRGKAIIGTVLGKPKAPSVRAALTGPVTPDLPASILQTHPRVAMFLDRAAAAELPGA